LAVDGDSDDAWIVRGLNPNHFSRVTFRVDQCRLDANMQTLKRPTLRILGNAETRQT
jgi:hypothetical protein